MNNIQKQEEINKETEEKISIIIWKRMFELLIAAFSLVAALAWNDAVQTLFTEIFGPSKTLLAKFLYAGFITIVIVWLSLRLNRMSKSIEKILLKKE